MYFLNKFSLSSEVSSGFGESYFSRIFYNKQTGIRFFEDFKKMSMLIDKIGVWEVGLVVSSSFFIFAFIVAERL